MFTKIKKFFKTLGPGLITGASDDDPSGIATYSQTGAQFGYSQLWTAVFSFPLMTVVQEMCARIGLVTGSGLSRVIRKNYPKQILYFSVTLLLIANAVNIGADLGAMAASAQMIVGLPFMFWLIAMTVLTLILEVFVTYKTYSKFLKWLTLSLISYLFVGFVVKENWILALRSTIVPHFEFSKNYLLNIIAILGTTISPYLYFWQTSSEVEEEVEEGKIRSMGQPPPHVTSSEIRHMHTDVFSGMFFSNVVMWFIIFTAASTLFKNGIRTIESAPQAAEALRPIAGDFAYLLFAIGIIGTGLLTVPVLAGSAAYAFSEAFGWREGLYRKFAKAHGFYGIITIATLIGLLINFIGINPIQALYYSAVVNGVIAPPLLILILLISNNKSIMGDRKNGMLSNVLGWATVGIMSAAAVLLLVSFFF